MELYPPDDPFLLNVTLLGLPLAIRWYGALIVGGAMLAGWLASRRAARRGYDPEHVWNLLLLGMVLGIVGARAYYVAFQWPEFAGRTLLEIVNPATGGLAIHGALIGAILAALIYTRRNSLPFIEWLDICLPTVLVAQALGRWGNFFNQEAYGRPTPYGFGVRIDQQHRLPPYNNMAEYPAPTLFHPTFLYESIWNMAGFGLIVWIERRFRDRLRTGDLALLYAVVYGAGRFWIEGLRTDSLCTSGIGGECVGALRAAQIASVLLFVGGLVGLYLNHRRQLPPAAGVDAQASAPAIAAPEPGGAQRTETASSETPPALEDVR